MQTRSDKTLGPGAQALFSEEGGTAANVTLQLNVAGGQTHVSVTGVVVYVMLYQ